ncbi:MAG: hypothetical protein JXA30_14670 [Deltaproteobacteria bacterium]|nr:hypothetical protein [Deltaproteobacteria bacterium]
MTNSSEQNKSSSVGPGGKAEDQNSGTTDPRLEALQKQVLRRARERADAASERPAAVLEHVSATPTRIGQPAFDSMVSEADEEKTRREREEAETVPSFPASPPADSGPPQTEQKVDESAKVTREPQVVVKTQVVLVEIEKGGEKEAESGQERREARRVLLRDGPMPGSNDEVEAVVVEPAKEANRGEHDQSDSFRFDDLTADGPLMTSPYHPEERKPPTPYDFQEAVSSARVAGDGGKRTTPDFETADRDIEPARSKKTILLGLVALGVVLLAVAGMVANAGRKQPTTAGPPKEAEAASVTETEVSRAQSDKPAVQISSSPPGAELVHEGAVVGNTPTKIERPTYEQIYLLRLPGYESQLVRVSPLSGQSMHITLTPADNFAPRQR